MKLGFFLAACLILPTPVRAEKDDKESPSLFKCLKYRLVGPSVGGRVTRACGIPGDPTTYYLAASAGGVWKTTDGGLNWKPIFDDQPTHTIGSLAVAPSDSNVIYVGSGEANPRGNVAPGNGLYKSEDAGKTWKHVWKQRGQIGTVVIDPKNADIAYAAVLGSAFGPNEERGVYRTLDGGKTWKRVLARDKDTGASDIALDPSSPRVLFAGLWRMRRKPWEMTSGGPGSGLYTSRDGGETWTQLVAESAVEGKGRKRARGLPEGTWGKICVAVAPSDGRRVYAMIEAEKGGLFRSDDGGETWTNINDGRAIRQRAWYFSHVIVNPVNPNVVYFPQVPLLFSIDGGKTIGRIKGPHHGDHHDIWIDPTNPKRMIDSNDGGVDISVNGGETWFAPPLPIAQFYRIETDNQVPYNVMGSMQDIGTGRGPSNSLHSGGIRLEDWFRVGGGEAGHVVPDGSDPNIIYAGEYSGIITRHDLRKRQSHSIGVYPVNPSGWDPKDMKYRFQWTAPILVSPHDSKVVYHASNVLFTTRDGGVTWKPISPDLTRNDKTKLNWSGGPITGDNTGVEVYCTIFAIAESPVKAGLLWAGSDDGLVHISQDAGKTWDKVTPKGLPEWATVQCIEPSPFDAETALVVAHNYRLDDPKPYLFRTTDAGKTWKSLTDSLPNDVWLHVVRFDRKKKGLLFLGTERGVNYSPDDGMAWKSLRLNLPTVAVNDLKVKDNDLVVGTNGRSIWILDDLSPLREVPSGFVKEDVAFLTPQPAIRWREADKLGNSHPFKGHDNPSKGAVLYYYLDMKPKGEMTITVSDDKGKKVATISNKEEPEEKPFQDDGSYSSESYKRKPLPIEEGLNVYVWDLTHEGARLIKGAKLDSGQPQHGYLVRPGKYTLKLTVEGRIVTRTVEVLPDPRVKMTEQEYAKQEDFALKIRDDISRLSDVVTSLRTVRKQIQARNELLDEERSKPLMQASKDLLNRLDVLEEKFHNPKALAIYDILAQRGGAKLYSQLAWLMEQLKDSDGPLVQGILEQYAEQSSLLEKLNGEWKSLVREEIVRLNEQAKKLNLPVVIVPAK